MPRCFIYCFENIIKYRLHGQKDTLTLTNGEKKMPCGYQAALIHIQLSTIIMQQSQKSTQEAKQNKIIIKHIIRLLMSQKSLQYQVFLYSGGVRGRERTGRRKEEIEGEMEEEERISEGYTITTTITIIITIRKMRRGRKEKGM